MEGLQESVCVHDEFCSEKGARVVWTLEKLFTCGRDHWKRQEEKKDETGSQHEEKMTLPQEQASLGG